jgi:hypothetical protein
MLDVKLMTAIETSMILVDKAFRVSGRKLKSCRNKHNRQNKAALLRASLKTTGKKITLTSRDLGVIFARMK